MSKLGAFYASKLGGFRESKLHARGLARASLPACPVAALLTLTGVDASTPCVNRLLGLGASCSAPYSCVTGVSTGVDGTYRVERSRGPTSDGWCEFFGEFDAPSSFTTQTPGSVVFGVPYDCASPVSHSSTRIRIFVRVNRQAIREIWVWSIENGVAAIPISFFNGYLYDYTYTDVVDAPGLTPTLSPVTFDGCAAATCGRLMSGGGFQLERTE